MNLPATIANGAWLASSLPAYGRFRRALQNPASVQKRILSKLLEDNRFSAYGKKYRFDQVRSYQDFVKQVPLVDYDELEPWIARIRSGEKCVLTRDPVRRLVPTSGSSGARKLIPYTAALQHGFNAAIGPWMVDLSRQYPQIVLGSAYWSVSPAIQMPMEESAVPIGFDDDSQYLGGMRKRLVEGILAVPSTLRHVFDIEHFRYLTLLCLLRNEDLRLISIWHPSFLTLLLDALPKYWDSLICDIATGGCALTSSLSSQVRASLRLRSLPARARQLEAADLTRPETLWPHLQLISCWGHGHAAIAMADLQRRFPKAIIQPKGLLATEAFVTLPFENLHPVAVCSHFFEFLDDSGRFRLAHELQAGAIYEVVVTTGGGLWRYRLGDQVEMNGCIGKTPSLRFLVRADNVSDYCGEKLSEAFVAKAIQEACGNLGEQPRFAMLAPDHGTGGWHYTLYLEGDSSDELAATLEAILRRNPHYAYCRDLGQLQPLQIFPIASAGFETFAKAEVAAGRKLGDIKPRALSNQKSWAKHFPSIAKEVSFPISTRQN